ncbi:ribonucleoside triphosphate reductase, partial [Candidatus Falkowbacteria bacterium CG_4_10_14_0_8_um_filter_41_36]
MSLKKEMITKIIKRSGEIVDFDPAKITKAVLKAAEAVGLEHPAKLADKLTEEVLQRIGKKFHHHSIPAVEEIQDIVEETLIINRQIKMAKSYILYRDQHRQLRD